MSSSQLCNCAGTRCLQRGKVDGLITCLALGVERHFHAKWLAHNSTSLASPHLCLTSIAFILSYVPYIALSPSRPLRLSLLCSVSCKWRNTSGLPVVMRSTFPRPLFDILSSLSLFAVRLLACVSSKVCSSAVAAGAAFLVFQWMLHSAFHLNKPVLLRSRTHASCQCSFALHSLLSLITPLLSPLPFLRFLPILLER